MKRIQFLSVFVACLGMMALLSSCKEDQPEVQALSEEEVAEVLEASMAEQSGGMSLEVAFAAETATAHASACDYNASESINRSNSLPPYSYSYNLNYNASVSCNQFNIPEKLDFSFSSNGSLTTARLNFQFTAASGWVIEGINPAIDELTLNGSYERSGSYETDFRNARTFSSELTLDIQQLTISKETHQITGGLATFDISGTTTDGGTFSYTGQITFLGNGQAQVELNGATFDISL